MKCLWTRFLSPTPKHIRQWQGILFFIGGLSSALLAVDESIPSWIKWTCAIAGYTGTFLGQFITKKGDA